jgi:hypothetical protein
LKTDFIHRVKLKENMQITFLRTYFPMQDDVLDDCGRGLIARKTAVFPGTAPQVG